MIRNTQAVCVSVLKIHNDFCVSKGLNTTKLLRKAIDKEFYKDDLRSKLDALLCEVVVDVNSRSFLVEKIWGLLS